MMILYREGGSHALGNISDRELPEAALCSYGTEVYRNEWDKGEFNKPTSPQFGLPIKVHELLTER